MNKGIQYCTGPQSTVRAGLLCLLIICLVSPNVWARGNKNNVPMAPTAQVFPEPGSIVFPSMHVAAGINPAALGLFRNASSLQLAYSPSLNSGAPHSYFGSFAYSKKNFGLGLGVTGNYLQGTSSNGAFVGTGYHFEDVSLGIAVRDHSFSGPSTKVDFGMIMGSGKGLNFGLVLYQINQSSQMNIGLGYSGGKKYNLEVDLLLPTFSQWDCCLSYYQISLAANIFIDSFSVHFRTRYSGQFNNFSHTLAVSFWFSKAFNGFIQYVTPQSWTVGAGFLF